jgi:hypothetical protein
LESPLDLHCEKIPLLGTAIFRGDCHVTPTKRGKGRQRHEKEDMTPENHHPAMIWAQCLKRVFNIDVSTCPKCGGKARVIACIEDPVVIDKITSLGP